MIANLVLLAGISLAWAAGYLFVSDADHEVPPVTATAAMALVAAAVMVVSVLAMRRPLLAPVRRRAWVPVVMAFTAIALPNLAVVLAERHVQSDLASLLGTTVPILTLLLTTFITRQTAFSGWRILGVAVALAGLIVFVGWENLLSDETEFLGMLTMMSGGLVFALNGIFVSYQSKDVDEYALATWTMIFGAGVLSIAAFAVEAPLEALRPSDFWPLAGEGTVGMALAYLGYFILVARGGAYFASLYAFLVPPFGVIASALVFGEALTLRHFAGLCFVLMGLALMVRQGRPGVGRPAAESRAIGAGARWLTGSGHLHIFPADRHGPSACDLARPQGLQAQCHEDQKLAPFAEEPPPRQPPCAAQGASLRHQQVQSALQGPPGLRRSPAGHAGLF